MKIKNLRVHNKIVAGILSTAIIVGGFGIPTVYYAYENKKQICEKNLDSDKIFVDENGKFNCYFDIGEHIIQISRNDAYYHKSKEIEGYTIKEVEINGWRDNNKITYVNIVPVVAIATKEDNGGLEFNDFGTVLVENYEKKK